jgi:hypothetical protein
MRKNNDKYELTDKQLEIYKNFNVNLQKDNLLGLNEFDRFVMLYTCTLKHDPEQIYFQFNGFEDELINDVKPLSSVFEPKTTDKIKKLFEDNDITMTDFIDGCGKIEYPDIYTEAEAKKLRRDNNINTILD